MNYLAIDYGSKRVGLAYTANNIIFTLPRLDNNDDLIQNIQNVIESHSISKVYVGISEGKFATEIQKFVTKLTSYLAIPVETVEESVSTIEAHQVKKSGQVDSVSAAIILGRAIGYN